ncbi:MAG: ribonuclease R, partial [Eubacterium sp.]|nr:ribonuclease R [Eubacterium sp.]
MQESKKAEREASILSFIEDRDYRPMRTKEMANLFCVPKKERGEFHDILNELIRKGKIEIDRRGLIRLPENRILTGEFMAARKGFGFVRVEGWERDIFIPERCCANAFHGDLVQIRLTRQAEDGGRRSEGEIIRIVERKNQTLVGTFTRNKNVCFVIPDNEKITRDIYIAKGNTLDAAEGHKVVVELSDFGDENNSPEGH